MRLLGAVPTGLVVGVVVVAVDDRIELSFCHVTAVSPGPKNGRVAAEYLLSAVPCTPCTRSLYAAPSRADPVVRARRWPVACRTAPRHRMTCSSERLGETDKLHRQACDRLLEPWWDGIANKLCFFIAYLAPAYFAMMVLRL
jgi:hypothetical protein